MPRSMVGLLAAVATTMSALVAFAHGVLIWVIIVDAAAAAGLVAYLASPDGAQPELIKKNYTNVFFTRW